MAVFFKTPAQPCAVVRAEHVFLRRPAERRTPACVWRCGPDGRPVRVWQAPSRPHFR